MRPQRLELEGFTVFREATVVDFGGADFFALTGPTGSGKSSVIDAIVFALYGSVPRYDDKRLVAPVISQGAVEARVRLDFTVGDVPYTAVRVVRRTKAGATTREARLEGPGDQVLAGTADEMGPAVEGLVGLGYEHFTKCVVLPQGAFARFLHDKPERRQELLVQLLDIGVYERMGRLARQRAEASRARVEVVEQRLAALAGATPDALAVAQARVDGLTTLRDAVDAELPALDALALRVDAAAAEATQALERVEVLGSLVVPPEVAALDAAVAIASAEARQARHDESAAAAATEVADAARRALPDRALLHDLRRAHDQIARQREQRAKAERLRTERQADERAAGDRVAAAEAAAAEASAALTAAESRHRAAAVRGDLVAGEPCPVCQHVVAVLPPPAAPPDLEAARARRRETDDRLRQERRELAAAERELNVVEGKLAAVDAELEALDRAVASAATVLDRTDGGDPVAVAEALAAVEAADAALAEAQAAERRARSAALAAEERLVACRDAEGVARAAFDAARDRVAALCPPPRHGGTLAAEWEGLTTWATEAAGQHRAAAEASGAEAEARAAERDRRRRGLAERCRQGGVPLASGDDAGRAVGRALAAAELTLEGLSRGLAEAESCRAEADVHRAARDVAVNLAAHLRSDRFEKWVLDEALGRLVEGASTILHELSTGQYTLAVDPRTGAFDVVDHRNAAVARSARTLSGGETFLASLALALALADQLAQLSARDVVRLESMFLDEGFGTLDAETLDAVATAVEELGARGRMVGLISHVADLAERVPTRFEVVKAGVTASVRRVEG